MGSALEAGRKQTSTLRISCGGPRDKEWQAAWSAECSPANNSKGNVLQLEGNEFCQPPVSLEEGL